jgi:hypothetical protein
MEIASVDRASISKDRKKTTEGSTAQKSCRKGRKYATDVDLAEDDEVPE